MKNLLIFLAFVILISCNTNKKPPAHFTTLFETSNGAETATYQEVITFYKDLAETYSEISLFSFGQTDAGEPLHLVVFNTERVANVAEIAASPKNKILINNGIHPGESDGIDASMLLLRNIVASDSLKNAYKNTIITVIPVYNVGGALVRNSDTRVNQNGPNEYGFRGNAQNYDLNRDFIKQDTKNAAAFAEIFHAIQPQIFIDNHVSNGADYQYALTHLFTQHNKLGGSLGAFIEKTMRPALEKALLEKGIISTPYVNVWGSTPEAGFSQFFDSPRYSTGYTTLFNTLGLMVETHMLKPYKTRVTQTYQLLHAVINFSEKNAATIQQLQNNAYQEILANKKYPIAYKVDKENPSKLNFKGYETAVLDSKVTNGKRLFYDVSKPFTKEISYYNNFKVTQEIAIPKAYILLKGWHRITTRLQNNNIQFIRFKNDTTLQVSVTHIAAFETHKTPYEGHYLHYNTKTTTSVQQMSFNAGDVYIPTQQKGVRYLLETLEATATDSFFNWNFFDTVLQQKEGFSAYVFEDVAATFLSENPAVKALFEEKLRTDSNFSQNTTEQLKFIYKQTPHYEKAHLRLPVFKVF